MRPRRILVIDDQKDVARSLTSILSSAGYEAHAAFSAKEAAQLMPVLQPDLVISDVGMPGMNGIQLVSELRIDYPQLPVILLSGGSTDDAHEELGESAGPTLIFSKPYSPRELLHVVAEMTGHDNDQSRAC